MGTGRKDSRTPFELLVDVVENADADALDRWHEFEEVSRGRMQLTWSEGLREMAGLAVEERTDEEIAADETGGDQDVLLLASDAWRQVRSAQVDLLEAAEQGVRGAMTWLDSRGIEYTVTPAGLEAIGAKTPGPTTQRRTARMPVHQWPGVNVRKGATEIGLSGTRLDPKEPISCQCPKSSALLSEVLNTRVRNSLSTGLRRLSRIPCVMRQIGYETRSDVR